MYTTVETLPMRLLDTLTSPLCGRDELVLDFDNSVQYKGLLQSATNSHPQPEYIRETVSSYFQYATLSHRWGSDEPVLRDVQGQVIYKMELSDGIIKLQAFVQTLANVATGGYGATRVASTKRAVQNYNTIGSMFRWYRCSSLTIVHLADVSDDDTLSSSE